MKLSELGFSRWMIGPAVAGLISGCGVGATDPSAAQRQRIDAAGPSAQNDVDDADVDDVDDGGVDVDDGAADDKDDGQVP